MQMEQLAHLDLWAERAAGSPATETIGNQTFQHTKDVEALLQGETRLDEWASPRGGTPMPQIAFDCQQIAQALLS